MLPKLTLGTYSRSHQLALAEKLGYTFGGFGNALVQQTVVFFYLLYLTDTVGLSPAVTGMLFLIARIFDAATDPLVGYLIDRWRPLRSLGRLRSWLLIGTPLLCGSVILLFAVPDASERTILVWIYASYLLIGITFDFVGMSYVGLTPVITQDSHERSVLSGLRILGSSIAALLLALGISAVGGALTGTRAEWTKYVVLIAGIALVALVVCAVLIRERVGVDVSEKLGWREALKVLTLNRPLLVLVVLTLGGFSAFAASGASWIYYFQYGVGRQELFGVATLVGIIATLVGAWIGMSIVSRLGKKFTIGLGLALSIFSRAWLFFIPLDSLLPIFLNRFLQDAGFGIATAMLFSMIADTVEYAQWRTGVRAEGLISAAYTFTTKLAAGIGAALVSGVLQASNYVPNAEQTAEALRGIVANVSLVPAACLLLSFCAIPVYNLTEEQYLRIVDSLKRLEDT